MKELARRITNRIKYEQGQKLIPTLGEVITFNSAGELNAFVNTKVVTKSEALKIYPDKRGES